MKALTCSSLRAIAITCLFAIGIATTIATGGSGGGTTPPPPPPPPPPDGRLVITADNAHDVSSALIIAIGLSSDIGDISSGELGAQGAAGPPPLLQLMRAGDLAAKPLRRLSAKVEDCLNGGTADVTAVLADPNTLTVGDRITAVFVDCDDGEGYVISGTLDLTVAEIQGDLLTNVFVLGLDVLMTEVEIIEGADSLSVEGDFSLTLDSGEFPVVAQIIGGAELSIASGPQAFTFTNFEHRFRVDLGVEPNALRVTLAGRFDSALLGGMVDYETSMPVRAKGDEDPYTGSVLVEGADNSRVLIVINDSTSVTLEVDENGDGVVDAFIDTTFAALNGHTSTINSSTAPLVAREVTHVVNGFASLAVTPGAQFMAEAPLGQIRQQAIAGDFGPLEFNCLAGGTATVSGFIENAGTYGFGDALDTTFSACARGGEVLDGKLDFAVRSYDQLPGDAYALVSDAVETGFERQFGGATFSGSGVIEMSYDFRFTSPGITTASAWSSSFTVTAGGIDHVVSPVSVTADIFLGPPPLTASRFSTGTFSVPGLDGEFIYQSLTADTLVLDADPATGPVSGELLVTASDGSSVKLVAIDELSVRLYVDLDGNGFTDIEINTTWAALQ